MPPSGEKGLQARQHILRVAEALFARQGFAATPTEAILQAAGISRGALYHHFSGKEAVFEAVFEALEAATTAAAVEELLRIDGAERQLRSGCRYFLSQAQAPHFRQIGLIDAPAVLGWEKWRAIEERHGLGVLKLGLAAALAERGADPRALDTMAHLLLAAMIEAALVLARSANPGAAAAECATALDRVIDGFLGVRLAGPV